MLYTAVLGLTYDEHILYNLKIQSSFQSVSCIGERVCYENWFCIVFTWLPYFGYKGHR